MKKKPELPRECVYPIHVTRILRVCTETRWRMEKRGDLPPRDFCVNDEPIGWRPETIRPYLEART